PVERIDANLKVPGSKSQTARALICAVLADGECVIRDPLRSDDTEVMCQALRTLGYEIRTEGDILRVQGKGGAIPAAEAKIDAKDAGTAMRFLTALLTLGWGRYEIDGSERMRQRPIGDLVQALAYLGGGATTLGDEGFPPVVIEGAGLRGGTTSLKGGTSSQFLSALLLVAPYAENSVEIEVSDDLVSRKYVDLTLGVMADFGVIFERDGYRRFHIPPGRRYRPTDLTIEGDASSASYFFAAAAVTGGRVRVENLDYKTRQGDVEFVDILGRMGCKVETGEGWTEVSGGELQGVEADLRDLPDVAQTLAVTSLFARGKTTIQNIDHLRTKETNRIEALTKELRKVGAGIRTRGSALEIQPRKIKSAEIETYGDHRMAMSFALLGLRVPGIRIRDPGVVSKSFPDFFDHLEKLGQ
ncbi:MAG: 3-phosphoshikimate 1-carboxyvinyltransferase, partial [Planctomycetota bacterium]|nr:3-phosphoshikimate 1-carboxyvinyltransferase [Planctomycetota bacterium]